MCGILGYFARGDARPDWDLFMESWSSMTPRGTDGCGFAYPSDDGIVRVRSELAVDKFVKSEEDGKKYLDDLKLANPKYALFHVRKTTVISKTDAVHAHPYSNEDMVIVHNGVIRNAATLAKKYNVDTPEIDSGIIPDHFSHGKIWESEKNFQETLESFVGEMTIAAIAKNVPNKIWLATNGERPLAIVYDQYNDIIYFCSVYDYIENLFYKNEGYEEDMLGLKMLRIDRSPVNEDPYYAEFTTPTWLIVSDEGISSGDFKKNEKYETYTSTAYSSTTYSSSSSSWNQPSKTESDSSKNASSVAGVTTTSTQYPTGLMARVGLFLRSVGCELKSHILSK